VAGGATGGGSAGGNALAPVTGLLNTVTSGLSASGTATSSSGSNSGSNALAPVTGLLGGLARH